MWNIQEHEKGAPCVCLDLSLFLGQTGLCFGEGRLNQALTYCVAHQTGWNWLRSQLKGQNMLNNTFFCRTMKGFLRPTADLATEWDLSGPHHKAEWTDDRSWCLWGEADWCHYDSLSCEFCLAEMSVTFLSFSSPNTHLHRLEPSGTLSEALSCQNRTSDSWWLG